MNLEKTFSANADENGIFKATIYINDKELKDHFCALLCDACYELDIICGVNNIEGGLELGFEDAEHYSAAMKIVEPPFFERIAWWNNYLKEWGDRKGWNEAKNIPALPAPSGSS